ncbi:MAG: hypothetical protein RI563_01475 [Thiohalophilus sp.]|uniref:hypothetical protein n=1 Tax=Thiohalophilus sp. TaxID=3028392 RepID=UPI00287095D6|nr:hypothetical protein [Thiohalophilus sp.]MDR9435519.1 hypothetical protein [Thiohalophilus sp.]
MIISSFCVSRAHPSLEGHFPGNPIVPGVVALELILEALMREVDDVYIHGFPQVKFHAPIYPEQDVSIRFTHKKDCVYDFICEVGDKKVISGKIKLALNGDSNG